MGIRFFCPQGHKLNVKSFLAGKKGFCPHCNAKVDIPLTSTRRSSRAAASEEAAGAGLETTEYGDVAQQVAAANVEITVAADASLATATSPSVVPPANASSDSVSSGAVTPQVATPTPTTTAATANVAIDASPAAVAGEASSADAIGAAGDPISEAPEAVWYVRPVTGGQYGPTSGDVLRQWIEEGRVAADTYVWRDGWPTWQLASAAFSQFQIGSGEVAIKTKGYSGALDPRVEEAGVTNFDGAISTGDAANETLPIRHGRRSNSLWLVVSLAVIAVILVPVLIYVIW